MTDHTEAGLTAPFKSGTVWMNIDLFHDVDGGENMDNDTLYAKAEEWLESVDADELKAMILGSVIKYERWE